MCKKIINLEKHDVWQFIEQYYPNYSSSSEIATNNDLLKIINQEYDADDQAEKWLHLMYNSDPENPQIKKDYESSLIVIYEKAIVAYLKNNTELSRNIQASI